jgi:FkbM family methyltransferase
MKRQVQIGEDRFEVEGDDGYMAHVQKCFEPNTVALLRSCCAEDARVLDVGANIGMTSLALSRLCGKGRVVAIEPVRRTFEFLQRNLSTAGVANVAAFNFAAGSADVSLPMQANLGFLAGAFVSDKCNVEAKDHFRETVRVKTLDGEFPSFSLERLDFMKIDVEGFELEVLRGAEGLLKRFQPTVLLEMNHWCLNMFRRVTLPEFRERLLAVFPHIYAVEQSEFLDVRNNDDWYLIAHEHIVKFKYVNLLAGFDKDQLLKNLEILKDYLQSRTDQVQDSATLSYRNLVSITLALPRRWKVIPVLRGIKAKVRNTVL